jgi:hypothetical protein
MLLNILFRTTRNNENKKTEDEAPLLPNSGDAFQEPTRCCLRTMSLYGVIFGLLGTLMKITFIINIYVKFSSTPTSTMVLATAITYCFWTIGMFGVFRYFSSLQQYSRRQQFLSFFYFMGGYPIGCLLASVIWSLRCSHTPAPLLLYSHLMRCTAYLIFIKIMIHVTNWIHHGCDGWKEEEESLNEGERATV